MTALAIVAVGTAASRVYPVNATDAQPLWCISRGEVVDSAFMANAALRLLGSGEHGTRLKVEMFEFVPHAAPQPVGAVVSLVVDSQQPPLGGGGLVWVDAETGCAIHLKTYE